MTRHHVRKKRGSSQVKISVSWWQLQISSIYNNYYYYFCHHFILGKTTLVGWTKPENATEWCTLFSCKKFFMHSFNKPHACTAKMGYIWLQVRRMSQGYMEGYFSCYAHMTSLGQITSINQIWLSRLPFVDLELQYSLQNLWGNAFCS